MKAISLWEPWASLMRTGAKTIETRGWPTRYRGPLLICASARRVNRELEHLLLDPEFQAGLAPLLSDPRLPLTLARRVSPSRLLFGRAVAVVTLYDCRRTESLQPSLAEAPFGDYSPGRYAWLTRNLRTFPPFLVTGRQGLFEVSLPDDFEPEPLLRVGEP